MKNVKRISERKQPHDHEEQRSKEWKEIERAVEFLVRTSEPGKDWRDALERPRRDDKAYRSRN